MVYYNNQDGDDDNNDDYDWSSGSTTANAVCVALDDYEVAEDGADEFDDEDEEDRRHLSSDSNDNDSFGGSLGCNVDGTYVIAAFQSSSCDGNYFACIVDDFDDYNDQHNAIGCQTLYEDGDEVSIDNVYMLLNNSWSCDLRLYPNGCPDPFGILEKYDFALRTVAHGGNAQRAYQNMLLKTPLYIVSYCLLAMTLLIFVIMYLVHNETRVVDSKGGKNVTGYLRCLGEDIALAFAAVCAFLAVHWQAFVVWLTAKTNQLRNKYFTKDGSWKKKGDDDDNDDGNDEEQPSYTKGTKKKKSSKSKAKMIADDDDINIKSNSNSTEESDDSYVKVADDGEVLTNNKKNVVSTTPTKSTMASKLAKNRSLPAGVPHVLSKDEERLEMSLSDTLSGTWA